MKTSRVLRIVLLSVLAVSAAGAAAAETGRTSPVTGTSARAKDLLDRGVPIRSADPADADLDDLLPLKRAIGRARVVLLGEQSHGDGTTFLMKCRLVRFLHEEMGFDVLAWESGLYDCREMDAALRTDLPLPEAIDRGIFAIWGLSRQVRPVFAHARAAHATERPLEMAGFDCQFSSPASRESFPKAFARFFDAAGPSVPGADDRKLLASAFDLRALMKMTPDERAPYKAFIGSLPALIEANRAALDKAWGAREVSYWDRVSRNLGALYEMLETLAAGKLAKASDNNARDRAMGETLVWLANEYYRGRKIIVWAASFHDMWRGAEIETGVPGLDYKGLRTMGDEVLERLGDKAYSITFTAYQGKSGMAHRPASDATEVPAAAEDSLEAAFHATGRPFMFLDLRALRNDPSHWIRKGVAARPLGYSPMTTDWTRHFDAVVFTDVMEPSARVDDVPAPPPTPQKGTERSQE